MDASADSRTSTRSKNKNQHPGAVQLASKRKRRTKAEMAADKAAQEAKKQEKGRKDQEKIKNIASLEGEMARKDADADAAHPRSRNGDVHILVTGPDVNDPKTDVHMEVSDDDTMQRQPKGSKPKPKLAARPVTKNSQHQVKVPNVADRRDLTTDKGSSIQKSNRIRKFLFFFAVIVHELVSFKSRR